MKTRAEFISEKTFSLSLSAGFFGYFAHLGFAEALDEMRLKPSVLSGSSAGALVAAGLASGRSAKELREIFLSIKKSDFWDPSLGFGYLKGQKIEDLLGRYCAKTFAEVQIPLHISVFNIKKLSTEVISEGPIARAGRASASVPFLFHPVKFKGNYLWDGGVRDRAGHKGVESGGHVSVINYLGANDLYSRIEDRFFYRDLHAKPFFFKLLSPHKIGPTFLEKGSEVVEYFRKNTLQWLIERV